MHRDHILRHKLPSSMDSFSNLLLKKVALKTTFHSQEWAGHDGPFPKRYLGNVWIWVLKTNSFFVSSARKIYARWKWMLMRIASQVVARHLLSFEGVFYLFAGFNVPETKCHGNEKWNKSFFLALLLIILPCQSNPTTKYTSTNRRCSQF